MGFLLPGGDVENGISNFRPEISAMGEICWASKNASFALVATWNLEEVML